MRRWSSWWGRSVEAITRLHHSVKFRRLRLSLWLVLSELDQILLLYQLASHSHFPQHPQPLFSHLLSSHHMLAAPKSAQSSHHQAYLLVWSKQTNTKLWTMITHQWLACHQPLPPVVGNNVQHKSPKKLLDSVMMSAHFRIPFMLTWSSWNVPSKCQLRDQQLLSPPSQSALSSSPDSTGTQVKWRNLARTMLLEHDSGFLTYDELVIMFDIFGRNSDYIDAYLLLITSPTSTDNVWHSWLKKWTTENNG